ncbi:hypothetical protein BH09ACT10_BH09ACT10_26110 [soil metagenome]
MEEQVLGFSECGFASAHADHAERGEITIGQEIELDFGKDFRQAGDEVGDLIV